MIFSPAAELKPNLSTLGSAANSLQLAMLSTKAGFAHLESTGTGARLSGRFWGVRCLCTVRRSCPATQNYTLHRMDYASAALLAGGRQG